MRLQCIKGIANDVNVFCLQDDVVEIVFIDENGIEVVGIAGWCEERELFFSPKEIAEHFKYYNSKTKNK